MRNVSLLVASAVNREGYREIRGICGSEGRQVRLASFLRHLLDRGLKGVKLILSDACRGLVESIAEYLPEARWQRCMVHFYRNVFSHVSPAKAGEVSHMLKAIHASENLEAAKTKAADFVATLLSQRLTRAAELVEAHVDETLSCYAFPDGHWSKIRTNNPLERIMKKIRRRTCMVGAFPDGESCLNLAAARLRHIAGTKWATSKYMNIKPLYEEHRAEAVACNQKCAKNSGQYHLTPADVYLAEENQSLNEGKGSSKTPSTNGACNTATKPHNIMKQMGQSLL